MFKSALKTSKKVLTQQRNLHSPVIVSAVRTPVCSAPNGKLSSLPAPKLGAIAIRAAVEKTGLTKTEIQEVIMGCVLQANQGQAPARQAAIHAGLSQNTIATTINKMCASGLKSVMYASQAIMLGHQTTVVAGGMESMSNAPHYLANLRTGLKAGDAQLIDAIFRDGLKDAYETDKFMGHCAEDTAKKFGFTREDQDNFAIESYKRAIEATKAGYSKNEIVTVTLQEKTGPVQITEDDEPKNFRPEKMPTLKPAFIKDGTVTAANASKVSDGASALVITSEEKASRAGMKPLARIIGFADAERAPVEFTIAPADAIPKALKMAGLTVKDVDYFEINEAFSGVALANTKLLDLDPSRLNVFGGAVALGHPIGASGARILTTLINILKLKNAKIGVAAICNGGGGASAVVIENLQ